MISVPFVGPSYGLKSISVDSQSSVNLYPDPLGGKDSKSQYVLQRTPGLKLEATLNGTQSVRGLYKTSTGRLFGQCGAVFNEILADNTVINHGSINTGGNPNNSTTVKMSDNGEQLILLDGTNGWIFTLGTNTLTLITDEDFPQMATHVDYLDGYFIVNVPDSGRFQWSALDNGFSWDTLDFATAEGSPDNLVSLIVAGRKLWLMGEQSWEAWFNTGDSNAAFRRYDGSLNNMGIAAKYSLSRMDKNIFWLGANDIGQGQVFMNQGYTSAKVSTFAIDEAIQSYSKIDDAIGFCYQQNGNKFYQLSFPLEQKTWVFDLTVGEWHERSYRNSSTGLPEAHRANCQAFFNGKVYVGDRINGKLYSYDSDTYTDNGDIILLSRTSPPYWNNLDRLFFTRFQLDIDVGVGLSTGQGSNPKIMLENSNDGGHTFGTGEERTLGAMGEYNHRVFWTRQGSSRARVARITYSEPTKFTILNAFIELGPGT